MDLARIKALIDLMAACDLTAMEVSENGWTLRLARDGGRASPPPPRRSEPAAADAAALQAPLSGIVHLRPSPQEPPFVQPGQAVSEGETVCIIEAMKVFNAIRAERDGTVEAVLVASGSEVEAGQTLMRIV